MDVEASRAIRQAEVGASQTMIERTKACFGIKPEWLAGDTAYGSAANLDWLVNQQGIAPHVPVIDKSQREDGTFSREEFVYDEARDIYICPAGKTLATTRHVSTDHTLQYLGSVPECRACPLKAKCCPNMPARRIKRDVNEAARDVARALAKTQAFAQSRRDRKKVEMLFAHLKRILRLDRLVMTENTATKTTKHAASSSTPDYGMPKLGLPNTEMPEAFREMAEKGVAHVRDTNAKAKVAYERAADLLENTYVTFATGAQDYNLKLIEMARTNTRATFDYAYEVLAAKSPSEFIELSTARMRNQFDIVSAQNNELCALAQKVATDVAEP